ncbi:hypothetical protein KGQ20_05710 [Catenulispora sp. NF23]|uniref:hypothetical protein n=1 Tax=Catenulispora pinistramenti TaxID=2705254 RepID=UPI001BAB8A00|nr:hypothetical protein [Catenulispora pinistramenti]MBS2532263.1 hypothetical protein [Catenulispora pinistramenti]
MYRQGDVLIVPVTENAVPAGVRTAGPKKRRPRESMVLALGESTGHAHALLATHDNGDFYPAPSESEPAFVFLPLGGKVVHEEHGVIPLPEGWFKVVRQREYEPRALRSFRVVAD